MLRNVDLCRVRRLTIEDLVARRSRVVKRFVNSSLPVDAAFTRS